MVDVARRLRILAYKAPPATVATSVAVHDVPIGEPIRPVEFADGRLG